MDRMAAAVGAFACIWSDPVEPVDPEKRSTKAPYLHLHIRQIKLSSPLVNPMNIRKFLL